ncbi:beta-N-acetylhexosaminidase [Orenia metallireducens]|uniref:beta-N-acetylhexosaminidase n=1 Tax=Orenia metallireducens TaxID=1413210 RepID=A0A285HHY4_9FIRM|nr:glycoside hydrolase family 3 N-terminal domain-containing protein [Orenia metallireducens]PRX27200.1 beta-N-acetylhexosaminidase [Orenia metallireducens]SNY35308.1 beta-N-acetylhexosaminidase [Orenia metallireducens]
MNKLREKPFYLSDDEIKWAENIYEKMTIEEKIGQLFCPISFSNDEKELKDLVQSKHIGGVLYREGEAKEIQNNHRVLQDAAKIPLLIASNLEYGGTGSAIEGTFFGRQMLVAATADVNKAYQLGKVSCKEGSSVGVNWSFAPVVDIDYNFRNPITNVRTYGDNPEIVLEMGKAYMKAAKEEEVAVAIKHFPGDGVDERDQHLLTSVNTMDCEEWDSTFGKVYQGLIDEGALTVMAGHIALPAYEEAYDGKVCEEVIPATLSKNILGKLLREKLGFNGLICTDATPMVGFCSAMERRKSVPLAIESGCDIFLFNRDLDEDYKYMMDGYENGLLSEERLKEAVLRILATKAALKLHEKQAQGRLVPDAEALSVLKNEEHDRWAKECADQGVTLVKDTANLLPLNSKKHKRVLVEMMGDFPSNERVYQQFEKLLNEEGFEVSKYIPEDLSQPLDKIFDTVEEFKSKYDLVIYIGNIETASNKTVSRLNWYTLFGLGNNMPWFVKEVPTLFISVGNPYHLFDAPMIKTYINGYCNSEYVIDAIMDKVMGRSEFKGTSPIDPFCGREDTKY